MRIASLHPAATEIAFALGAGEEITGVSHACDYPPKVEHINKVTSGRFDPAGLSSREIYDHKVEINRRYGSLYKLDETALWGTKADVLLTQGPGDFSLVSLQGVRAIAEGLNPRPELVMLYPRHLDDVIEDHTRIGFALGRMQRGRELAEIISRKIAKLQKEALPATRRRRVAFIQWVDPSFSGGYWVSQLIEMAGGRDCLNTAGLAPGRVRWNELLEKDPEVLVIACEDMDVERVHQEALPLMDRPGWWEMLAVRRRRVYVGSGVYFTRSSPRLLYGMEALAWAIQPELFPEPELHVLQRLGN